MKRIPFDKEKEMVVLDKISAMGGEYNVLNYPRTPEENLWLLFTGKNPLWMPSSLDIKSFNPRFFPENTVRGLVSDAGEPLTDDQKGGIDIFGTEWEYIPVATGSMVKPGNPRMTDANDWEKIITLPKPDEWDWAGGIELNKDYVIDDRMICLTLYSGFMYERLVSYMDFEGAAVALIDDEQKAAVSAFMNKCADECFKIFDRFLAAFPTIEMISLHDDWGSQRAPFFSVATAKEMLSPVLRRMREYCSSRNIIFQLHSCGKNEMLVPAYIAGGVQYWNGQPMNDKRMLFEQYGSEIILGVDPPAIASDMDASAEELYKAAEEYCNFFIRDGKCHVIANLSRTNPLFCDYVYEISRKLLNP